MESYVVRVYRRDAKDSEKLAGLVELVDADEKKPFTSFEELRNILTRKQGHAGKKESNGTGV